MTRISILAPSSPVPIPELRSGEKRLQEAGFSVEVDPQVRKKYFYFAGTVEERAQAFLKQAYGPSSVIWAARGGYGASALLPILEKKTKKKRPPPKLLVGFSDLSAILGFVHSEWKWPILHAPMPGVRSFEAVRGSDWSCLLSAIRQESVSRIWKPRRVQFLGSPKATQGKLLGGNLAVLTGLIGTPYFPPLQGKLLFLEDAYETQARLDRMVAQWLLAGAFNGVKGIFLGEFSDCPDVVPMIRSGSRRKKLRPSISHRAAIQEIFGRVGKALKIPVVTGLPVGHGEKNRALPLGADYRLSRDGEISLEKWPDWAPR